ncbi:MAG: PD-(D/E)XK nuclease family protein, partial [Acidimicrobiales bacterium]
SLHILDYKTGKSEAFSALCEDDPDLGGTKLQLAVYGAAARAFPGHEGAPVTAEYWFVSTKGQFKRVGYPVTEAVLKRVGQSLGVMVAGIEAGVFPARPTATATTPFIECHPCDPDGLGVTEARRRWEAKRADPALALYAGLAEPDGPGGPGVEVLDG